MLTPCLALFAAMPFAGCSKPAPTEVSGSAAAAPQDLVTLDAAPVREGRIRWEAARMEALSETLVVTGRIGVDENLTSRVGAIADGRIVAVFASVGDRVKKGQLLAHLHSHEVHDARAEFAKARAELSRRSAELDFAANARDRAAKLYELKAASLEHLQRAQTDLRSAELAIQSSQADINRIEEHLRHLGLSAAGAEEEYTKALGKEGDVEEEELIPVTAPMGGTVLKRFVNSGTIVTPASDLLLISDLSSLWVTAEVPEKHLGSLKIGRPVQITVQAYGERIFPARITLIGDTLNPDTRTVQLRCQTRNEGGMLKPEMYAMIRFDLGESRQALMIPASALQDLNGQATVFLREEDTRYRARAVRAGRQSGGRVELLEGLKAGDAVVTTGSFLLKSELLKRQMSGD